MITTTCKSCGNSRSFDDSYAGKKYKCPGCGNPVTISSIDEIEIENKHFSEGIKNKNNLLDQSEPKNVFLPHNKIKKSVITGVMGLFSLLILIVALKFVFSLDFNKDKIPPSPVRDATSSSSVTQTDQLTQQAENNSNIEQFKAGYYIANGSELRKIYFHNAPDISTRRKAYLSTQETVYVQKVQNNFGYIEFANTNGQTSYGWIEMQYLIVKPN